MQNVWRIIDANLNRASEGLRVIEEVARFVVENGQLTAEIKQCRHRLVEICRHPALRYDDLVMARDAEGDVGGAHTYSQSEGRRNDYKEIAVANIKRVQEAARVLEEFGKVICPEAGFAFKQFRFHTYTLEKSMAEVLRYGEKPTPIWDLYVVTGDYWSKGRSLVEVVSQAVAGGADIIQLREKELATRDLIEAGKLLREITRKAGVLFIVNDRVDVALAVDADGVHIGQDDMPLKNVRRLLGFQKIIGVSTHSVAEARLAEQEGADYLGIGPISATGSKRDAQAPKGIQLIRDIRKAVRIPCIAIGGITHDNVEEVVRAGADGAAVITAVVAADDMQAAAMEMKQIIQRTKEEMYRDSPMATRELSF